MNCARWMWCCRPTAGGELRLRVVAQPEKELAQRLAHLGLDLPQQDPDKCSAGKRPQKVVSACQSNQAFLCLTNLG